MARIKQLRVSTPQGDSGDLLKDSRYVFNYSAGEPAQAISLTMPIRAESYSSGTLLPIFEMNRPEGYLLAKIEEMFAKAGPLDDMGLLHLVGGRQIGRLSYAIPESPVERPPAQITRKELLSRRPTADLFDELVAVYFGSGISGVQPKVLIPDAGRFAPLHDRTTLTYSNLIVKASGDEFPHLTQNEYLCMSAARRAGLAVPQFWLSDDGGLFVVERFDLAGDGVLGFEDMTVLMNRPAREKYRGSYENIARAIQLYCADGDPLRQLQSFYEYVCLIVMTRNGDGHLKNFGLLYTHPGERASIRLAPLFDVVTTSIYAMSETAAGITKYDRTLALNLAKSRQYPNRATLLDFGRATCQVRRPERAIERIAGAMSDALREEKERIPARLHGQLTREWDEGRQAAATP
ncbi:MAG: type II toxin-antitoxin system HipA family toxin [Steroidobacteraceae bacterium]